MLDELLVPVLKANADSLDFQTIYDVFDDSALTVANDGSYITFDTNPYNFKDSFLFTDVVLREIKLANQIYGLPTGFMRRWSAQKRWMAVRRSLLTV